MARNVNFLSLTDDVLKLDKDRLNKEVLYPIVKAGYDVATGNAITHRKTGELNKNLKTVSLLKRSADELGYILYAGRRIDYTDGTPHFVLFYKYENGRMYRQIKRAVKQEINKLK